MGGSTDSFPSLNGASQLFGPMDPNVKAVLVVQAQSLPDESARDLVDVADATPYGKRVRWERIVTGAVLGVAFGVLLGRVWR